MAGFVSDKNPRAGNENLNVAEDKVYPTTQITILDELMNEIGWVSEINQTQDRAVEPVRHLNAVDAGRIVQGVPRPANYTLSITGFAIYKPDVQNEGSIVARMIKNTGNADKLMKSLEEQKVPFMIREVVNNPDGNDEVTVHHGCWLTRYNKPSSINNAFVTETADVFVSFVDKI